MIKAGRSEQNTTAGATVRQHVRLLKKIGIIAAVVAGMFLAPRTSRGIRARNYLNNQKWFLNMTFKLAGHRSTNLDLPDYAS